MARCSTSTEDSALRSGPTGPTAASFLHPWINMYHLARFAALAVAIGIVGCGKSGAPSYANVSGAVTYNGKPIEKGQITFARDGRPPTQADIVDGKYTGQAMVGSNRVSITAYRK